MAKKADGEATSQSPKPSRKRQSSRGSVEADLGVGQRLWQISLLVAIFFALYATVALGSWSAEDPAWSRSSSAEVKNLCGPVGAWVADLLYQSVGFGAWAVVPVGVFAGLQLAGRNLGGLGRLIGLPVGWLCVISALGLGFGSPVDGSFPAGGWLGLMAGELLRDIVGPFGAWLLLSAVGLIGLTAVVHLNWGRLAGKAVDGVEAGIPTVTGAGAWLGRSAVRGISRAGAALKGVNFGSPVIEVTDPDIELADDEGEPASRASQVAPPNVRVLEAPRRGSEPAEARHNPPASDGSPDPVRIRTTEGSRARGRRVDARDEGPLHLPRHFSRGLPVVPVGIHEPLDPRSRIHEPDLGPLGEPTATPPELGSEAPRADRTAFSPRSLAEVEWEPTIAGPGTVPDGPVPPSRDAAKKAMHWRADGLPGLPSALDQGPAWKRAPADPPSVMEGFDRPRRAVASNPSSETWQEDQSVAEEHPELPPFGGMREYGKVETEAALPSVAQRAVARPPAPASAKKALYRDEPLDEDEEEPSSSLEAEDEEDDEVLPPIDPKARLPASAPKPAPVPASKQAPGRDSQRAGLGPTLSPGALVSGGEDDGGVLIENPEPESFELPHLGLLDRHERTVAQVDAVELRELGATLEAKLADFGVSGTVQAIRPGPVITTFEYLPTAGIKLSRIAALEDDIAMALKALRVRIVAPIPGKGVVGFEVPNKKRQTVWVRDLLASDTFRKETRMLPMALGKNVEGHPEIADLASAPHLLVAGTTGSGKSVGVNAMLLSMLYTRTPAELRLILIDPKMLEFELYQDIPHLLHPVVTDPQLASAALKWACTEMDNRYRLLAAWQTRNIASYNEKVRRELAEWTPSKAKRYAPKDWPDDVPPPMPKPLPYIVVVIDELADLMMVAAKDVEISIARLAQKARAAGIHLIVATQRPEKTVVTGLIKANMPSRIAYQVRSKLDGRIILDQGGAESLLGKGDMLFLPPGVAELKRIHGPFVDDDEVRRVTDFLRAQGAPVYEADIRVENPDGTEEEPIEYDELYDEIVAWLVPQGKASTSMVQRQFKIGYNRAARVIEVMEKEGLVGPADGAKPRKILVGDCA